MSDKCLRCACFLDEHCFPNDLRDCIKCKNYIPQWNLFYNLSTCIQDLYNIAKKYKV